MTCKLTIAVDKLSVQREPFLKVEIYLKRELQITFLLQVAPERQFYFIFSASVFINLIFSISRTIGAEWQMPKKSFFL